MKITRIHNSCLIIHRFLWLLLFALSTRSFLAAPGDVDTNFNPCCGDSYITAVQPDGKIVIGVSRFNIDGTPDTGFNANANNHVNCTAIQTDGKIVIGGAFTTVNGTLRNHIARLNADGTLDTDFDLDANDSIVCTAVQPDGKIVIGGYFTSLSGTPRGFIARLNVDGTLDLGFNPNVSGGAPGTRKGVFIIALQADGKIVIGGHFDRVGGTVHPFIARLNANGTLDPGFNPRLTFQGTDFVLDGIYSMTVQADDRIIIGGAFDSINGVRRFCIARLDPDGTLDPVFNPDANNVVFGTALQADGKIIIGGYFTKLGGIARNFIGRVNGDGTLDTVFNSSVSGTAVYTTSVQTDGKIIIGGEFTVVGGLPRGYIARLVNDPVTQNLSVPNTGRVEWLRGGASPEAQDVAFELSTDGGTNWTALGTGSRIVGGWELTGLSLPASGSIRARARVTDGVGCTGLVEAKTVFSGLAPIPRLIIPSVLSNGAFQFGFTNLSGIPFTALATTNLTLLSSNWTVLGPATEIFPGQFQFTDLAATNFPHRFYQVRSP
jgi:uncharacterized delta-60 repeat protein